MNFGLIRVLNQTLNELKLEKHPEKTPIGKIERGFDFLGYHFSPKELFLAKKTAENFLARALRLYEQKPGEPFDSSRLGEYVQRWVTWADAGLPAETTKQLAQFLSKKQPKRGVSALLPPITKKLDHLYQLN